MKYSIVNYKKIVTDNSLLRYDAEYYHPLFLQVENQVKKKDFRELRNVISILTDYHSNGSYETLRNNVKLLRNPDYALMVRTVDFEKDDFENDVIYISEHAYNFLKKSKVYGKDIIINKIGNAGKVYIVPPLDKKISLGMNQFMIRPNKDVESGYLYSYLISYYGCLLLKQKITGAVPLSIDKDSVKSIKVPILIKSFQKKIDCIIDKYLSYKSQSKQLYFKAEQLFLSELNLLYWKPKHRLSFVKNYSDTVSTSRIDAEYFQPIYDEIINKITSNSFSTLDKSVAIKKCIEPGSNVYQDNGIIFLRVSNLSKFGFKDGNQQYISTDFYAQVKQNQPKKGEILLTKDASPGVAYYLKDGPEKMIPSGGILRLKVKDESLLLPEYLTLVLNSIIVQKQIERDIGGSVINHWLVDQVKNTLIPILSMDKQRNISNLINDSFNKREISKNLLEIAKTGVEIAIEQDENTAENWIRSETEKLGIDINQ